MNPRLKESIMALGLVATGVVEFIEGCDAGLHPLVAGSRAYERTKARGEIIRDLWRARQRARIKR